MAAGGEVAERVAGVAVQGLVREAVGGAGGEDVLGRAAERPVRQCSCAITAAPAAGAARAAAAIAGRRNTSQPIQFAACLGSASPARRRGGRSARPARRRSARSGARSRRGALRAARRRRPRRRTAARRPLGRVVERALDRRRRCHGSSPRSARPESWIPRPIAVSSRIASWALMPIQAKRISSSDDSQVTRERAGAPGGRRGIEAHAAFVPRKTKGGPAALPVIVRTPTVLR